MLTMEQIRRAMKFENLNGREIPPVDPMVMPTLLRLDCDIDGHKETKIIAVDSGTNFVGTVGLEYMHLRSANIRQLFVASLYRGRGIGALLVEECCRIAQTGGCETLGLAVEKGNNKARKFYTNLGFQFAYQYDDGSNLMVRDLWA